MAWIESHQQLANHPKTRKLARRLEIDIPTAVGHLHLLWWWSLDHAFDGDLTQWGAEDIALGALWEGDPQTFIDALTDAKGKSGQGFIASAGERVVLHDWDIYTAHLKARRESAQKANHVRWHVGRNVIDPSCEWCRNQDSSEQNPNGQASESTEPDLTGTKPEPNQSSREPRKRAISEDWTPTRELVEWALEKFPEIDIVTETEKFRDHFTANGKPMKDWNAAWRGWFRRSQDFAPRPAQQSFANGRSRG